MTLLEADSTRTEVMPVVCPFGRVEALTLPAPQQATFNGLHVPLVLEWQPEDGGIEPVVKWLQQSQDWLKERLSMHGAVLLRGFPLQGAPDFNEFMCAFKGWEDLAYEKSLSFAVRTPLLGRVCTTNDGRNGGLTFHHEQAQTPLFPSKLVFYCEIAAKQGGGTGVSPSSVVCSRLEAKFPEFIAKCEQLGVKYTCELSADGDISQGAGRGWRSFLGRKTRSEAEAKMKKLGYTWTWADDTDDSVLRATSPALLGVRKASGGQRVYFNQIAAQLTNATEWIQAARQKDADASKDGDKEADSEQEAKKRKVVPDSGLAASELDKYLTWADDTSMAGDREAIELGARLCDEVGQEIHWQNGDVALLDNMLVMHKRLPWTGDGPRRVLASLVD